MSHAETVIVCASHVETVIVCASHAETVIVCASHAETLSSLYAAFVSVLENMKMLTLAVLKASCGAHICNSSAWEAGAGLVIRAKGQPGL